MSSFNFNPLAIKQEPQSEPPYLEHREISPMPEIIATRVMPLETYKFLQKRDFSREATTFPEVKKLVYDLVKEQEHMWNGIGKAASGSDEDWQKIGIQVYKRLDVLVSVKQLRYMWQRGKDALRTRLRKFVVEKKLNEKETEENLWTWDLYGHIRFYRKTLAKYEREIRKQVAGETADLRAIQEAEEDDDDIIFEGFHLMDEPQRPTEERVIRQDEAQEVDRHETSSTSNFHMTSSEVPMIQMPPIPTFGQFQQMKPSCSPNSNLEDQKPHNFKRPRLSGIDGCVDSISQQTNRIFEEHPDKKALIRKAIFSVILAFDDPECEYTNLGDVFEDLAAQFKVKRRRDA